METETYKTRKIVMLPTDHKSILWMNCNKLYLTPESIHNEFGMATKQLYIISDEEIREGDWCLHKMGKKSDKRHRIIQATKSNTASIQEWWRKIIASTDLSLNTNTEHNPWYNSLPQIPQSFISLYIKEYNAGKKIEKVEVVYDHGYAVHNYKGRSFADAEAIRPNGSRSFYAEDEDTLKINPDNTVNIKFKETIQQYCERLGITEQNLIDVYKEYLQILFGSINKPIEKSWNREEVIELCDQAHLSGYNLTSPVRREEKFNDWVNQNLYDKKL